jgi:NodT family efflux transporter outer membrane factor (OMF) lipoprotein
MSGAITSPAAATAPWWRQFDDAAMNAVIEAALSANGDLETARARVLEARAMRQGAAARLRPQLDVGTEIARRDETESTRPSNSATAQLEARWDADLFGANRRTLEAREALLGAAEADADGVALALAIETARSYVDLREAQQRLAIARRNLSAQRETLALTRARQAAGIASLLDVSQAETLALATESALPALEAQAKAAIRRLESLTAVAPGALDPALAGEKPVPRASFPRALETPANVIAQRPDLRIAERRLAAFNAERAAAEAARYPSLILRAVFGVRALSPETIMTPSQTVWSIAGGLAAPLFDAGRIEAEVRAADARTMQAAAQYRQRVVDAFGEVESALALLVGAENERTALVRTAASSAETRALAEMRYRRGLAGFIDVLDAQRAVYQAEDRLSASEAATARRIIGLHAALGSPATNSMSRVATAAWQ